MDKERFYSDAAYRKELKDKKRQANAEKFQREKAMKKNDRAISAPLTSEANKERVQEFKRMLLHAPVGESVIRKVIDIARNDDHPGQMAAIKICMDRLLPVSLFEGKSQGERPTININIGGLEVEPRVIEHDDT